jgi:hypothetical protein
MKVKAWMACWVILGVLPASSSHSAPLSPAFTYQGQLVQNGTPVTGVVTFRFSLWDASGSGSPPTGGNQIGSSTIYSNATVTNGLFSVVLNGGSQFGPNAFDGDERWLQIEVCSDGACSSSTVLSPRQLITATPYSSFAAGPWKLSGGALSFSGGNVGIGTTTPHAPLELQSGFGTEVLRFGLDAGDYHFLSTGFHGGQPYLNFLGFNLEHTSNDVRRVMTLQGDGSVGIGTPSPAQALDVRGNIAMGPSGQYFATGSEENLRMIRGNLFNGVPAGGCYSVSHPLTGVYDITYCTPFSAPPSVTATPEGGFGRTAHIIGYGFNATQDPARVRILIEDTAANPVDWDFDFIAIGPR